MLIAGETGTGLFCGVTAPNGDIRNDAAFNVGVGVLGGVPGIGTARIGECGGGVARCGVVVIVTLPAITGPCSACTDNGVPGG